MSVEVGTPLNLDIGPASAALDRLSAQADLTTATIRKGMDAANNTFAEAARQATAYSDSLARQQQEYRGAVAATQSAREEVRRLTDEQRQFTQEQKKVKEGTDEYRRLQKLLEQNRQEIAKAKQAINENKVATQEERAAVEQLRESRRQETNQTKLAAAAARDAATATKQEAAAAKEVELAAKKTTDAGLEVGKSAGGFLGTIRALGPIAAAAFSVAAIKEFASNVNEAAKTLDNIKGKLNFATGSPEAAAREFSFLRNEANRLGLDLTSTALSYGSFISAAKEGNIPLTEARRTFLAVSGATASLKLSAADTQGVLLALQQIVSKGTVSAEELRQQIGERLPGAFSIAARAIGVTESQLNKLLQSGSVVSAEFLPKFTRELEKTFGDGSAAAADALQANENRINNEWQAFLARFEGLASATTGVLAKFAVNANKFLDSFTTAGRLRQATQGAQQGIKDYGDTLDRLFAAEAERAKKNGEDIGKAVEGVASQQGLLLQKQLQAAQQELAKFDTSTKEGALFQGNFRGGSQAFNAARQDALRRVELIRGEQAAIEERAEAFKKANDAEATQLGRIIALRALIAANTKLRDETLDTKEGNAERVRLNALLKEENKLLDELLGKEEKARKARQFSYEAQLRALLSERATLTSLAGKASEQLATDATARAKAVFEEGLRQVEVVRTKLVQRELDLRKAAGRVGGGAVARLGEKADGVIDGVQDRQLVALQLAAMDKYYDELRKITLARVQRLFDLRADSDAKEVEAVERKYDALIKAETDGIEREAIEVARAREQLALKAQQQQRQIDQTAALASATAQAVGQQFGAGTGVSAFEAKRAEQRALLEIEKKAAEDSLNNTLNKTGKAAEIERQALRAQLGRIKQQEKDLEIEETKSKFSIYKLILGENDDERTRAALDKVASTVIDSLAQITDAEEQAAANRVAVSNQVINELTGQLAAQIQLNQQGSASNIKGLQDQIAAEKQARREALEDQRKAAKEKVLIDTLTQASSIATAAAEVFAVFAALGPLGVVAGIAGAGLLIGAFAASKIQAYQAAGNIGSGFFKGGYTGGESTTEERGVVHGKEFVHTADVTEKYRLTLFEPLHKNRPEDIDWSAPQMQPLLASLMPDLELPGRMAAEKQAHYHFQQTMATAPLEAKLEQLHDRLGAIEGSNQQMLENGEMLRLSDSRYVRRTPNGSEYIVNVGG